MLTSAILETCQDDNHSPLQIFKPKVLHLLCEHDQVRASKLLESTPKEKWKEIPGPESYYKITDKRQVRKLVCTSINSKSIDLAAKGIMVGAGHLLWQSSIF